MATNKVDLGRKHLDALARGDWTTYRDLMTDDAVYEEEATQRHVDSADRWLEISKAWKSAFPDLKATIKESFASGDSVVCELEWSGTQKGTLLGPFGSIPPTNRAGTLPAVLLLRFDGDRIRACHHYFDMMTMLTQLGIGPQKAQPSAP